MDWIAELNAIWTPPAHRVVTMSEEWKLARRGRLTASSRARSIAGPRAVGNFPKLREKILYELSDAYEWTEQSFAATDWGNKYERRALSNLEMELGLGDIESYEPGFLLHPDRPYVGCTPDLLIRDGHIDRTTVQVKCPYDDAIHRKTLLTKQISDKTYWYQIQWEAWVTGATKLLFVSYDPRVKVPSQQLVIIEVPKDQALHDLFDARTLQFKDFMEGRFLTSRPLGLASFDNL